MTRVCHRYYEYSHDAASNQRSRVVTLGGDGAWVTLGHARGADAKKPFLSPKCAYHNHVLDPAGGVPVWAYNWECVPGVPFAFGLFLHLKPRITHANIGIVFRMCTLLWRRN